MMKIQFFPVFAFFFISIALAQMPKEEIENQKRKIPRTLSPEQKKQVTRYFNEALKNYDEILRRYRSKNAGKMNPQIENSSPKESSFPKESSSPKENTRISPPRTGNNTIEHNATGHNAKEDKKKKIMRFLDEALKNYDEILKEQEDKKHALQHDRRETNHKLLQEQQEKLQKCRSLLFQTKLKYVKRFLILQDLRDRSEISSQIFQTKKDQLAIEYVAKVTPLSKDIEYYEKVISKIKKRLNIFQTQNSHHLRRAGNHPEWQKLLNSLPPKK